MARASYFVTPPLRSLVHRPQGVILVLCFQKATNELSVYLSLLG